MSNLLQVVRVPPQEAKKGTLPLYMEIPVDPAITPILVSSTSSLLWVEEAHPGDIVKAAVRKITPPGKLFWEIAETVIARSQADKWESVHSFTEEGVRESIRYLEFYEIGEVELLIPFVKKGTEEETGYQRPEWLTAENLNVKVHPSSWVPVDCVIAVPVDRDYVGALVHLNPSTGVVVVHNASRGIAIAKGV